MNAIFLAAIFAYSWYPPGRSGAEDEGIAVFDVAELGDEARPRSAMPADVEIGTAGGSAAANSDIRIADTDLPGSTRPQGSLPGAETVATVSEPDAGALKAAYEDSVRAHVLRFSFYPAAARALRAHGVVKVQMELDRDGHVASVWIKQSSGNDALDEAALMVIRRADPMPPIPAQLPDGIELALPLEFVAPRLALMTKARASAAGAGAAWLIRSRL